MKLNPNEDLKIDVTDLTEEFRKLPLYLFRYYEAKAQAEREVDAKKAIYDEIKAHVYKRLRQSGEKLTEKGIEAEIDTHPEVINLRNAYLETKRDLSTLIGAVESMKTKKDMLIQLGSDRRKEV